MPRESFERRINPKLAIATALQGMGAVQEKRPLRGKVFAVPRESGDPVRVVITGNYSYEVGGAAFSIGDLGVLPADKVAVVIEADVAHMANRAILLSARGPGIQRSSDEVVTDVLIDMNARRVSIPSAAYEVTSEGENPVRVVVVGSASYEVGGATFNIEGLGKVSEETAAAVVAADIEHMRNRKKLITTGPTELDA